jgi:hypothetical protein
VAASYHGWHVDAIWGKEQEDVVLLPVEHVLQAFAESDGGIADLAVRVRAFCVWLKNMTWSSGNWRSSCSKRKSQMSAFRT